MGILPIADAQTLTVSLALVTLTVSVVLIYLLFAVLGFPWGRQPESKDFLIFGTAVASLLELIRGGAAVKKALDGDRLAWGVVFAICCTQLHAMPAVNHEVFVCAARLKRTLPSHIQMSRLGKNGFALLMPHWKECSALIDIARSVEARLRRAVSLNTSR